MTRTFLWIVAALFCRASVASPAYWWLPRGKYVGEFSGKFNVPVHPEQTVLHHRNLDCVNWHDRKSPCFSLFYVSIEGFFQLMIDNTRGGEGGGYRLGGQMWGCGKDRPGSDTDTCHCDIAFGNNHYCTSEHNPQNHGKNHPVKAGDTISFYFQLLSNSTSTEFWYEMGWSTGGYEEHMISYMNTKGASALSDSGGSAAIDVVYEGLHFHDSPDQYWKYMPQSDFRAWDLKLLDQHGDEITIQWYPNNSPREGGPTFKLEPGSVTMQFPNREDGGADNFTV